jgi:glycerol-3-phosphate dehydrogenase
LASAPSKTADLRLHGWSLSSEIENEWERVYGADLPLLQSLADENPDFDKCLYPELPFRKVEVVWAARHEMARTVEDVLARRTRALFLNARASIEAAPEAARLLANELGRSEEWQQEQISQFRALAAQYVWNEMNWQ